MKNETEIVIEDGIPLPIRGFGLNSHIRALGVGQMFRLPLSRRSGITAACTHVAKKESKKFAVRKLSDSEIGIWRVK